MGVGGADNEGLYAGTGFFKPRITEILDYTDGEIAGVSTGSWLAFESRMATRVVLSIRVIRGDISRKSLADGRRV